MCHLHMVCHSIESKMVQLCDHKLKSVSNKVWCCLLLAAIDSCSEHKRNSFDPNDKVSSCLIRKIKWRNVLSRAEFSTLISVRMANVFIKNFMHFAHFPLTPFFALYLSFCLLQFFCWAFVDMLIVFELYDVFGAYLTIFFIHIFIGHHSIALKSVRGVIPLCASTL